MPGSHLDCEVDLDRAEIGVSIALADAALRALGGAIDALPSIALTGSGIRTIRVCGRDNEVGG